MTAVLLSAHVLAAILVVGPITVAASLFPRYARAAIDASDRTAVMGAAAAMHRIARVYAVAAVAVPVLGLATAMLLRALGQPWVLVSIGLTLVAGVLLALRVVPGQREILAALQDGAADRAALRDRVRRLTSATGMFALTWAAVVVLMILRPGSTTGVGA